MAPDPDLPPIPDYGGGGDYVGSPVSGRQKKQLTSRELLTSYWNSSKGQSSSSKSPRVATADIRGGKSKLSTEEIMRVAGARYVQFPDDQNEIGFSILTHPFGSNFSGLTEEEKREVEVAQFLLAAAEKVGDRQFDRAGRLLTYCKLQAAKGATAAQRVVLCFAEALQERVDRETGKVVDVGLSSEMTTRLKKKKTTEESSETMMRLKKKTEEEEESSELVNGLNSNVKSVSCHRQVPFTQVTQFTGIQTIIESTVSAKRIHLIDLEIRSGVQWMVLMQALADRNTTTSDPIDSLRISAVASNTKSADSIKQTGTRLTAVAESMNLPFQFNLVFISDTEEIRPESFSPEHDETVIVYAPLVLRTMLPTPDRLDELMSVVRNLDPTLMVVAEVEANHNSPSFVVRFIESLFFYSAYFDCLEACMEGEGGFIEEVMREGIRNMVAAEGEERVIRNVKMEVWRAFFRRFGMVEVGFSESSIYQANLVANEFDGCSVDFGDTCLFVGWKGTPILSLSAWKFG